METMAYAKLGAANFTQTYADSSRPGATQEINRFRLPLLYDHSPGFGFCSVDYSKIILISRKKGNSEMLFAAHKE
jgi:GTP-binding protein EngB required for normal cell division